MRRICLISPLLIASLAQSLFALLPGAPFAVQSRVEGDSCFIIWYYQGVNKWCYLNDHGEVDQYFFVQEIDGDNRALSRFDNVLPEYPIESVSIFIWGTDLFPEQPGGPQSPFGLSIFSERPADREATPIWGEDTLAAALAPESGKWHDFPVRELLPLSDSAFVQVRWLSETPAAPLLAVDYKQTDDSFYGYSDGDRIVWRTSYGLEFLIRLNYCLPDTLPGFTLPDNVPDSFCLFIDPDSSEVLTRHAPDMVIRDSLHTQIPVAGQGWFFVSVAALKDGQLGPRSAPIPVQGTEQLPFPLEIEPDSIFEVALTGEMLESDIKLSNTTDRALDYRIRLAEEDQSWLSIDSLTGVIPSGSESVRRATLDSRFLTAGFYESWVEISCSADGYSFDPLSYHITNQVEQVTGLPPEIIDFLPRPFLSPNYPNPFNSTTTILSTRSDPITIYNLLGELVISLTPIAASSPGAHLFQWDGSDLSGRPVTSGVYFYHQADGGTTRKMLLLK